MIKDKDLQSDLQSLFEEHDFNKTYEDPSIVLHTTSEGSDVFVSTKNVPRFVSILNDSFWQKVTKDTVLGDQTDNNNQSEEDEDVGGPLCFTAVYDNSIVSIVHCYYKDDQPKSIDMQISTDGSNWRQLEVDSNDTIGNMLSQVASFDEYNEHVWYEPVYLNAGQSIYFKGTDPNCHSDKDIYFVGSGLFDVSGRLNSISDNNKTVDLNKNVGYKYQYVFSNNDIFDSRSTLSYSETYDDRLYIRSAKNLIISKPTKFGDYDRLFQGQVYMADFPKLYFCYSKQGEQMYENFSDPSMADMLQSMGITPPTDYEDFCNNTIYSIVNIRLLQGMSYADFKQTPEALEAVQSIGLSQVPDTLEELVTAMINAPFALIGYRNMYALENRSYYIYDFLYRNVPVTKLSNDGTTLNFDNDFDFPFTIAGNAFNSSIDYANYLYNINGFETLSFIIFAELIGPNSYIDVPNIGNFAIIDNSINHGVQHFLDTDVTSEVVCFMIYDESSAQITLSASEPDTPHSNYYYFAKWQKYNNGGWQDISTDLNTTVTVASKKEKYKACYDKWIFAGIGTNNDNNATIVIKDSNGNILRTGFGDVHIKKGETITFECIPNEGYKISSYVLNSDYSNYISDTSTTHTFENIQENTYVNFVLTTI